MGLAWLSSSTFSGGCQALCLGSCLGCSSSLLGHCPGEKPLPLPTHVHLRPFPPDPSTVVVGGLESGARGLWRPE